MTTKYYLIKVIIIGLSILFIFTNCTETETNQTTTAASIQKILTQSNDFNIVITLPDTIGKDEEFFTSIHITNPKYKLIHASLGCNVSDTSTINKHRKEDRIFGCNKNLFLENDSVKIWLNTGFQAGKYPFEEITLLAKGVDNNYYYQKCTFNYCVK